MPAPEQFAANLAMMFADSPFLERFERAAAAGFSAVEISTPELFSFPPDAVGAAVEAAGLRVALFNMPPGSSSGMAAVPGAEAEFMASVDTTLAYCAATGCTAVHCMAGVMAEGTTAETIAQHRETYLSNLRALNEKFAPAGVYACLEPLNPRQSPHYFLKSNDMAAGIIAELGGLSHVRLQFDFYHTQIICGDVTTQFRKHRDLIGHVQIAGVPERFEPDETQELNYPFILAELDRLGAKNATFCAIYI
jgi:hydroxypyruvate isomerase